MRTAVLAALLGATSFLAGLWTGSRLEAPAVHDAARSNSQVELTPRTDPALVDAIDELRREIASLRNQRAAPASADESRAPLHPVQPADAEAVELVTRLRELVADASAIDRRAARTPALRSVRDLATAPGFSNRDALFHDLDTALGARPTADTDEARAAWKEVLSDNSKRWEHTHRVWTLDEIAAQYGPPDEVRADGEGPSYVYTNAVHGGATGSFVFQSRQGYIYDVDVHLDLEPR